jgi:imidazolonepropionase-like amidohydrolase
MKPIRLGVVLLLVGGAAASVDRDHAAAQSPTPAFALVGGTLIDGTGAGPVRDSVILVRGDRIERVGTTATLPVPPGYEQIPTEGMTVLPGLWDLHVHLMYAGHPDVRYWFNTYTPEFERVIIPASAEQMLMAGVTAVRDLAAPPGPILAVKKRIANGEIAGPTLYVAGPALTKGGASTAVQTWNVSSPDDAKAKTAQLIDAGVDWIKVINADQLTADEMKAIVDEAHGRGRKVAAHAFSEAEIRRGLIAGIDDFQHVRTQTREYPPDVVALIRERVKSGSPLYWTVTAGANGQLNAAYLASNPEFLDDPANFIGLPQPIVDDVRKAIGVRTRAGGRGGSAGQSQDEINAIVKRKIAQLRELGVQIVFGTDVGSRGEVTGHATWMEADLWVHELGMDPMTVIRGMTLDAARMMGDDRQSGSITEGKFADVIAVRGDPLRHIDVLRDPRIVIKYGRRFK